jgi:hypothetical protein
MDTTQNLSQLVTELSKTKPDLNLVKSMCQKTGFKYSTDLIQLMSDILMTMNFKKAAKSQTKNLNLNQNQNLKV